MALAGRVPATRSSLASVSWRLLPPASGAGCREILAECLALCFYVLSRVAEHRECRLRGGQRAGKLPRSVSVASDLAPLRACLKRTLTLTYRRVKQIIGISYRTAGYLLSDPPRPRGSLRRNHLEDLLGAHLHRPTDVAPRFDHLPVAGQRGEMAVEAIAARENAASARTMRQLPDIVKAIALNNKIDESREFAARLQTAKRNGAARGRSASGASGTSRAWTAKASTAKSGAARSARSSSRAK